MSSISTRFLARRDSSLTQPRPILCFLSSFLYSTPFPLSISPSLSFSPYNVGYSGKTLFERLPQRGDHGFGLLLRIDVLFLAKGVSPPLKVNKGRLILRERFLRKEFSRLQNTFNVIFYFCEIFIFSATSPRSFSLEGSNFTRTISSPSRCFSIPTSSRRRYDYYSSSF